MYAPSARAYRPPDHPEYPFHDRTVLVTVFAGQHVGVTEIADDIWLVSFMNYD
jgi:hypothetical protein